MRGRQALMLWLACSVLAGSALTTALLRVADPAGQCRGPETRSEETPTPRPKSIPAHARPSEAASGEAMWLSLHLAARVRSLQASLDSARSELTRRSESQALVEEAIHGLSEPELRGVLATALRLSSDELDEIRDLPAFARRASEIAMAGLLYDDPEPLAGSEVFFTDTMPAGNADIESADRFSNDQDRIYAVFETPLDHSQQITLKWSRTDDPEILLFARRNIRPEDQYGFVYRRRGDGWTPGEYRVDVFGGDEDMAALATGFYSIE